VPSTFSTIVLHIHFTVSQGDWITKIFFEFEEEEKGLEFLVGD